MSLCRSFLAESASSALVPTDKLITTAQPPYDKCYLISDRGPEIRTLSAPCLTPPTIITTSGVGPDGSVWLGDCRCAGKVILCRRSGGVGGGEGGGKKKKAGAAGKSEEYITASRSLLSAISGRLSVTVTSCLSFFFLFSF